MRIRVAGQDDIKTLFAIGTSVKENYQSRAGIAALGLESSGDFQGKMKFTKRRPLAT